MRQFHFEFYWFFGILDRIFLTGFSNPFRVHSEPSFLFELNFNFSLVFFFVDMRHFEFDFLFFIRFFKNGFLNSLVVRSRSSFLFSQ